MAFTTGYCCCDVVAFRRRLTPRWAGLLWLALDLSSAASGVCTLTPAVARNSEKLTAVRGQWAAARRRGLACRIELCTLPVDAVVVVTINEAGVAAGASGTRPLQTDVFFGIRMRLRDVGTTGDGTAAGTCDHIAINNSTYNNISHHPYWPGGLFNPAPATDFEIGMCSIGIAELLANPCSDLTSSLTVGLLLPIPTSAG